MASYYFQRGEEKAGPFNIEEMTQFLKDGRVGYDDLVMREGEDQWRPVHSIPELEGASRALTVARGVASDPPSPLPPLASRQTPAPVVTGGRAARNSSWTPGQPPRRPGIFVRFNEPLPDVSRLIERAGTRWEAIESGRSRTRWSLVMLLLGLTFVAAWIDRQVGLGASVFSTLVPFGLAGTALVLLATRRGGWPARAKVWERVRQYGCVSFFILPFLFVFGAGFLGTLVRFPVIAFITVAVIATPVILVRRFRRKAAPGPEPPSWRARVSVVTAALEALRDDAAPGKPVSGWLDLTGADQGHKLFSVGKSRSGARAEAYRDDWWSLSLPLRDGNRLRITASDRLKLKRGVWRKGTRKSKWKAGSESRLSSVDVRLRVNPAVYRIMDEPMPYVTVAGDSLSTAFDARDGLETKDLVRSLSLLYKRLEPLAAKAPGG